MAQPSATNPLINVDGPGSAEEGAWRKHGELVDLPSAVVAAGFAAGLTPVERCVALLAAVRDGRLIPRPSFFQLQQIRRARTCRIPLHLIAHEDVVVLRKAHGHREGPSRASRGPAASA